MAWNLNGQLIETCSCNLVCPCWFGVKELQVMDQGWCDTAILFRINEGSSDGVTLDGRLVVMAADFPGPTMFDGNATARMYIDDGATQEQMRELEAIFSGGKGGPMERLASWITNRLPTQQVSIQIQEDKDSLTATIGEVGEIKSMPMTNPGGKPVMFENTGPLGLQSVQISPSASRLSDAGFPRRIETKSGGVGNFAWSGE